MIRIGRFESTLQVSRKEIEANLRGEMENQLREEKKRVRVNEFALEKKLEEANAKIQRVERKNSEYMDLLKSNPCRFLPALRRINVELADPSTAVGFACFACCIVVQCHLPCRHSGSFLYLRPLSIHSLHPSFNDRTPLRDSLAGGAYSMRHSSTLNVLPELEFSSLAWRMSLIM